MAATANRKSDSWDKILSKFYVDMYLDLKHERNTTDFMRGYSKKIGFNESIDPSRSLWGFVSRLVNKGYADRSESMLFYTNRRDASELVVELAKDDFRLYGPAQFYMPLERDLTNYYTIKANGGNVVDVMKAYQVSPRTRAKDLFELKEGKFKNEQELRAHCQIIIDSGFGILRANKFFEEYREHFDYIKAYESKPEKYENPVVSALASKFNVSQRK